MLVILRQNLQKLGRRFYRSPPQKGDGTATTDQLIFISDINECEILPGVCEGGECINTDGSFTCGCPEGYEHDETTHRCVGK